MRNVNRTYRMFAHGSFDHIADNSWLLHTGDHKNINKKEKTWKT